MSELIILPIVGVFTSILSAVVGMAGGVTLLSIMTFFLTLEVIVPIHGVVQLFSNASRVFFLKKHAHSKMIGFYALGSPIGAFAAVALIKEIQNQTFALLLICGLIFYTLFKPKKLPPIKIPIWAFSILGAVSCFLGILIGATGPFLAVFFLRDDLEKKEIIATKAATQFITHILKIPSFLYLGFAYEKYAALIFLMVLATILGTKIGITLLGKVNEKMFVLLYKTALFAAGSKILWGIFSN